MDLKLDDTGDLDVSSYNLELTEGREAIRAHLKIKFKDIQGEWKFDTEVGFPLFDEVLVKNPNFSQIQNVFMNEIMDTAGVLEILSIEFEFDDGELSVDAQILTTDGILDFSETREI